MKDSLAKLLKKSAKIGTSRYDLLRERKKDVHIDNTSVRSFDNAMKFFIENSVVLSERSVMKQFTITGEVILLANFKTSIEAKDEKEAKKFIDEIFLPDHFGNNKSTVVDFMPIETPKNIKIKEEK